MKRDKESDVSASTTPISKKLRLEDEPAAESSSLDKKKAKKARKLKAKEFIDSLPTFSFDGNELRSRSTPITVEELRNLVLAVTLSTPTPRWLVVKNPKNIKHFVVLHVPGITPELLDLPALTPLTVPVAYPVALTNTSKTLTSLHKLFSHACPSRAPGETTKLHSVLATFLNAPLSHEEKLKRAQSRASQQNALSNQQDPSVFLMTATQMLTNGYRLPSYVQLPTSSGENVDEANGWTRLPAQSPSGEWIETPQDDLVSPDGSAPKQKVWALDCEMIETTAGRELARVSIVDFTTGLVVFDSLVKSTNPVTSYLTQFSGLTAEILSSATLTLSDIQKTLVAPGMIDSSTILLGHSLENDLAALKLSHAKVIDTAIIFHHTKGPPAKPGLKWLAQKWLGKVIQAGEGGHDSREDALTCVELLRKKMQFGVNFGRFDNDMESIFDAMTRHQKTSAFVGSGANQLGSRATTKVECDTDEAVMNGVVANISKHDFVFARLQQLSHSRGWSTPWQSRSDPSDPNTIQTPPPIPTQTEALTALDVQISQLHQSLPAYTALCIFTGHSDPRQMAALNKRKATWDGLTRGMGGVPGKLPSEIAKEEWWTAADGRALESETELAKKGMVFFCITLPKLNI